MGSLTCSVAAYFSCFGLLALSSPSRLELTDLKTEPKDPIAVAHGAPFQRVRFPRESICFITILVPERIADEDVMISLCDRFSSVVGNRFNRFRDRSHY